MVNLYRLTAVKPVAIALAPASQCHAPSVVSFHVSAQKSAVTVTATPVSVRSRPALNVEQIRVYVKLHPVMTVATRPVAVVKRLLLS